MRDGKTCVVLVIDDFEFGGAQRQVVELANNIDAERFDLHVCALADYVPLAETLNEGNRRLHVIAKRFRWDLSAVPRLASLLRRLQADVVHSYLFSADIISRLAGRLARTPVIVGSERNTDYKVSVKNQIIYALTRECIDLIVANSRAGAEFNSRLLGYPLSYYRVVYNGVDADRFVPRDGRAVREELGIGADELVVGMFASFKQQKNHALFFTSAKRVLQQVPNARLLLVGDELYGSVHGSDEHKQQMGQLVDDLGIRDRSLFLGNRKDVSRLYSACDVTVLSSLYEGTPNVLLESMACAVPVVATNVSDNAYVVPDGRVGYVVPLGDEAAMAERICLLLGDETLRRDMGQRGRAWIEREFSTAQLARNTETIYLDALDCKRRGRPVMCRRGVEPSCEMPAA